MKEITKIDMNKYLVIKGDDLEKYFSQFTRGVFTTEEEGKYIDSIPFNLVLEAIQKQRESDGKKENNYLVLNLEDRIDLNLLQEQIEYIQGNPDRLKCMTTDWSQIRKFFIVDDIAVSLVNAILKAKDDDSKP